MIDNYDSDWHDHPDIKKILNEPKFLYENNLLVISRSAFDNNVEKIYIFKNKLGGLSVWDNICLNRETNNDNE